MASNEHLDPMARYITFQAGEDLRCGDDLALHRATGKLMRRSAGQQRCGVALQDYREGDAVQLPAAMPFSGPGRHVAAQWQGAQVTGAVIYDAANPPLPELEIEVQRGPGGDSEALGSPRDLGSPPIDRVLVEYNDMRWVCNVPLLARHLGTPQSELSLVTLSQEGETDLPKGWTRVVVYGREDLDDDRWGPWERLTFYTLSQHGAELVLREPVAGSAPQGPYTREAAIEHLADVEHQGWSDGQRYLLDSVCFDDPVTGTAQIIPTGDVQRYRRLIATPYADLPEHSKQEDRAQVARYWPWLVEFVAGWIQHYDGPGHAMSSEAMAAEWSREMGLPE